MDEEEKAEIESVSGSLNESKARGYELKAKYKLRDALANLTSSLSKSNDQLEKSQKSLAFWTKIMAIAVGIQAFLIFVELAKAFRPI